MKFSIRLNNDLPVQEYVALARAAEQAGFDQLWVSDDLFLRGVWPILSACALATSRIGLGTCIVNPATMHPAEIAMQAASLDELSGGRLHLGLGALGARHALLHVAHAAHALQPELEALLHRAAAPRAGAAARCGGANSASIRPSVSPRLERSTTPCLRKASIPGKSASARSRRSFVPAL